MSETPYKTQADAVSAALDGYIPYVARADVVARILSHLAKVQPVATGEGELLVAARRHVAAVRHHWPETCKISDTYRRLEEAVLIAGNPRPAADRERVALTNAKAEWNHERVRADDALAALREILGKHGKYFDEDGSAFHRCHCKPCERARALLSATPAPQPTAPVEVTSKMVDAAMAADRDTSVESWREFVRQHPVIAMSRARAMRAVLTAALESQRGGRE